MKVIFYPTYRESMCGCKRAMKEKLKNYSIRFSVVILSVHSYSGNLKTDIGSDDLNFQIYKFIEEYGAGANHNIVKDIRNINSNDLYLVLDGQQRLTSLYIGLRGSRMVKKARRDEYEKQLLYLNLGYKPKDEDAEDSYQFEFMNPNNVPANDENNYWFAVGDILKLESVIKFSRKENLSEVQQKILKNFVMQYALKV